MEAILITPDLNFPESYAMTEWSGGNENFETSILASKRPASVDLTSESNNLLFLHLLKELSLKEFIFLKTSFLEMNRQISQLTIEMEAISAMIEKKVKELKKELHLSKKLYSRILMLNKHSISLKEVKTADRILAIQCEINQLYHHPRYTLLSDTLSRVRILPVDTLTEHQKAMLIRLGLVEEIRFPLEVTGDERLFGHTELSIAFMQAYFETTKIWRHPDSSGQTDHKENDSRDQS